jgi:catechol 2,3-dioxygenase-like lactoylglutathione lyase family enzyme
MIPIEGLFEAHISVRDFERSVAFYRDVVGLELGIAQTRTPGRLPLHGCCTNDPPKYTYRYRSATSPLSLRSLYFLPETFRDIQ